ncbi:MAG TPA: hypothetical protein VEO54_28265 [Thermoanaerobaculia bacterium]|nr:hypothetical protein [Thermoanaerobaculia bacterium]
MARQIVAVLLFLSVLACQRPDARVSTASMLTQRYSRSRFEKWDVRASAAGRDCRVLLVRTSIILDDSMVEAMHYGAGAYAVDGRGMQHFSREGAFHDVVYRDRTDRVWIYGQLGEDEARSIAECH